MKAKVNLIFVGISALVTGLCIGFEFPLWITLFNGIACMINIGSVLILNKDALVSGDEQ